MGDLSRLFQVRTAKKEAANCRFFVLRIHPIHKAALSPAAQRLRSAFKEEGEYLLLDAGVPIGEIMDPIPFGIDEIQPQGLGFFTPFLAVCIDEILLAHGMVHGGHIFAPGLAGGCPIQQGQGVIVAALDIRSACQCPVDTEDTAPFKGVDKACHIHAAGQGSKLMIAVRVA